MVGLFLFSRIYLVLLVVTFPFSSVVPSIARAVSTCGFCSAFFLFPNVRRALIGRRFPVDQSGRPVSRFLPRPQRPHVVCTLGFSSLFLFVCFFLYFSSQTTSANCLVVGEQHIFVGCADGIVRCFSPFTLQFVTTLPRTHYLGVDVAKGLSIRSAPPPSHAIGPFSSPIRGRLQLGPLGCPLQSGCCLDQVAFGLVETVWLDRAPPPKAPARTWAYTRV